MTRLSNPLILLLVHGPLMLLASQLLLESADSPGQRLFVPGGLRLDGETIAEVMTSQFPRHHQLGGPECLIAPGFIDTHLHLPQFEIIGAHVRRPLRLGARSPLCGPLLARTGC